MDLAKRCINIKTTEIKLFHVYVNFNDTLKSTDILRGKKKKSQR